MSEEGSTLVFRCGGRSDLPSDSVDLPPGFVTELWLAQSSLFPPGAFQPRLLVWAAFHHLRLFRNRDYGALIIRHEGRVAHRSVLFPPYFSFPFMAPSDVQIGLTYTDPEFRGRGLATAGIRAAVAALDDGHRAFWYLVDVDNVPSIRAARKAGLEEVGSARRHPRFGSRLLGHYELIPEIST